MKVFNTKNGFNYYEAMSSFQKAIRRCDEEEAVFWGIEFFESKLESHVWTRVFIIAQEDIGMAEPDINMRLWSFKRSYDYLEEKRPQRISKRLVYLNMILTLARAKKSRYVDLSYMYYWCKHDEMAKTHKIPDYAFDMHTWKGKKMGRGVEHFYQEGALINNSKDENGKFIIKGEEEMIENAILAEEWLKNQQASPKPQKKEKTTEPNLFENGKE